MLNLNKKSLKVFAAAVIMILCTGLLAYANEGGHVDVGDQLPLWSVIPFVGMLLSIAIFPLVKPEWWEHNMLKVAILWALIFLIPFGIAFGGHVLAFYVLETVLLDYLPFIVLLFGLFVAAGGIVLKGSIAGTTKTNLVMLLIGTALASWIGTTGAAMLMIRPIIRANAWREKKAHTIIFFIFMVANIGGCLTPVGDPPLFLGFLRNVPFFWTLRLFPLMILNIANLSVLYFIIDSRSMKKDIANGRQPDVDPEKKEKIRIEGAHNFIFIIMVVGAVILNGVVTKFDFFMDQATHELHGIDIMGVVMPYNSIMQMCIILIAAFLSMKTTKKQTREDNSFTFAP
ncbi:MAG: sodium:proton antiporter, partial [Firmicutes bacterium]|nr:sodium:proton antiporter [Bacillota bacterium]